MKKILLFVLFAACFAASVYGQNINLNYSVDDYSFYGPNNGDITGFVGYIVEAGDNGNNDGVAEGGVPAGDDYYPSGNVGWQQTLDTYGDTGNFWPNLFISQTATIPEPYANVGDIIFWRVFNAASIAEATMYCDSSPYTIPEDSGLYDISLNGEWGTWTTFDSGPYIPEETITNIVPTTAVVGIHPDAFVSWEVQSSTREYESFEVTIDENEPFYVTDPSFKLSEHSVALGADSITVKVAAYFDDATDDRAAGTATTVGLHIAADGANLAGYGNAYANGTASVTINMPQVALEGGTTYNTNMVINPQGTPEGMIQTYVSADPEMLNGAITVPDVYTLGYRLQGDMNHWFSGTITAQLQDATQNITNAAYYNGAEWTKLTRDASTNGFEVDGNDVVVTGITNYPSGANAGTLELAFGTGDFLANYVISDFAVNFDSENLANVISWTTAWEQDLQGFYVWRSLDDQISNADNLTSGSMINATNTTESASYSFSDTDIEAATSYYYWVHVVNSDATNSLHGPIMVTVPTGAVTFDTFTGDFDNDTDVTALAWQTSNEANLAGYQVWRSASAELSEAAQLTTENIAALNAAGPNSYDYNDASSVPNGTYYYWIKSVDVFGATTVSDSVSVLITDADNNVAPVMGLLKAYPNPFVSSKHSSFNVDFRAKENDPVTLKVYNLKGQLVHKEVRRGEGARQVSFNWHATRAASGVYFYRMEATGYRTTGKMLILK